MTYKTVGVCSANVERSAIFEAVLNHEINQRGGIDGLVVTSAGINVENIFANRTPLQNQIKILEAALHYGLVWSELHDAVESVVQAGTEQEHTDTIRALYGQLRPLVHGFNLAQRNRALEEVGITVFPVPYQRFDPRAGYDLVLSMAEQDIEKVTARYDGTRVILPPTQTYGSLVGREQLVDDVKAGLAGARQRVQYFMDTRKIAIDKIVELRERDG